MQKEGKERIYRLGSLPPFLLVFSGNLKSVDKEWNRHDLGCGCNIKVDPRKAKLLHWSCDGKPWRRLDVRSVARDLVSNSDVARRSCVHRGVWMRVWAACSVQGHNGKACSNDRNYWAPFDLVGKARGIDGFSSPEGRGGANGAAHGLG